MEPTIDQERDLRNEIRRRAISSIGMRVWREEDVTAYEIWLENFAIGLIRRMRGEYTRVTPDLAVWLDELDMKTAQLVVGATNEHPAIYRTPRGRLVAGPAQYSDVRGATR